MDKDFKELWDLNIFNLEKVYSVFLDIDEKYQLSLSPKITFNFGDLKPRFKLLKNKNENAEYLSNQSANDALYFLETMAVIRKWEHKVDGFFDLYTLSLDVEWFKKFKKVIDVAWKDKMPDGDPLDLVEKTLGLNGSEASAPSKKPVLKAELEIIYEIKYTKSREVLLNNLLLAKVNFNSENDNVFGFIFANPNRKITLEELKKPTGGKLNKSLHKILENLGFSGEIKRAFFDVSKDAICFRNPLTRKELDGLNIERLKFLQSK